MIAEVIVNSKAAELNRTFDYNIPDGIDVCLRLKSINTFFNKKNI